MRYSPFGQIMRSCLSTLGEAARSKCFSTSTVAAIATATLLSAPDVADAQTFTKVFSFPDTTSTITAGVDGNFYGLTSPAGSGGYNTAISTFTPSGQQATYSFATSPDSQGFGLTAGPDGNIWFIVTSPGGPTTTVARMTPQGSFTFFQIDPGYPQGFEQYNLVGLSPSRDNGIYSVYRETDQSTLPYGRYEVGLIYPDGSVDPHRAVLAYGGAGSNVGSGALGTRFIVSDDKGTAYFPQSVYSPRADQIDRQDAAGNALAPLTLPTSSTFGQVPPLTYGPDGAIWFVAIETASPNTRYIGRFTTDGAFSRYEIPSGVTIYSSPFVVGLDGALWTTGIVNGSSALVRVATNGAISGVPISSARLLPINALMRGVDGVLYYEAQSTSGLHDLIRFDPAAPTNALVSAVLPSSRSVQANHPAAAFATIVNASSTAGTNCGLASISDSSATFQFAATDPATNMITGAPRQRVNIPAGRSQSFVFEYDTTGAYRPTADVQIGFACDNLPAAATIIGVNSFHLTSDDNPVPDVIAVGLTPSNDGVAHTNGVGGTGIFAIATDNIGVSGTVTARARALNADTAVALAVCETDAARAGACKSPPASNVRRTIASGETPTWGVFAQAAADIPLDPAHNRIVFEFVDDAGIVRGSTGTAVSSH